MSTGSSNTPNSQTVTSSSVAPEAAPYYSDMLGRAGALTNINDNPYQTYSGQRVADFSGLW